MSGRYKYPLNIKTKTEDKLDFGESRDRKMDRCKFGHYKPDIIKSRKPDTHIYTCKGKNA